MASSQEKQNSGETSTEGDSWTHVGKQRGRKLKTHQQKLPPADRQVTIAQLNADLENRSSVWKASSCRKTFVSKLTRLAPDEGWGITKAIALALGSFSRDNLDLRKRSMFQLAAFLDLAETVQELQDTDDPSEKHLFAQDPLFTDLDKEFLEGLGFSVLGDDGIDVDTMAQVGERLGPDCFVFEAFLDYSLDRMRVLLNPALPLCIRTSLENSPSWAKTNPDLVGAEATELKAAFNANHDFFKFPDFEDDPTIFAGLRVFHKEVTESDEEDGS